jgi:hypothetical protein
MGASRVGGGIAPNSKLSALQLREDHRENAFLISQHVGIPESQHVITVRAERGIARAVPGIIRVLPAVNFDDEFLIATNEIYDIGPDGVLPNEFEPVQPPVAQ